MNMKMDAAQALQDLGFTDYEARAYVAMVEGGELNGYTLAKATGIPRANIYAVADKLVQRGAARRAEYGAGVAYVATAPERLLRSIEIKQQRVMRATQDALGRLAKRHSQPVVLNLRGDEVLISARQLIDGSDESLLIALQPAEATALAAPMHLAHERGVAITILCLDGCCDECGGCTGNIYRYHLAPSGDARWLVVVGNGHSTLLGNMSDDGNRAVLTEQPLVVELASAYIRQSVTLAIIGSELVGQFTGLLSADSKRLLDGLYSNGDFLAHLRALSDVMPTRA